MYAFQRDIVKFVKESHGNEGEKTIKYLIKKTIATDEEIVNGTGLRENIVRKILYDLHANNTVSLIKTRRGEGRDYEFKWKINYPAFYRYIITEISKKQEEKREMIKFLENTKLYSCGNNQHPQLTIEEAFEYDFKCPLCGKILYEVDHTNEIQGLKNEITEFEKQKEKIEKHYKSFIRGANK